MTAMRFALLATCGVLSLGTGLVAPTSLGILSRNPDQAALMPAPAYIKLSPKILPDLRPYLHPAPLSERGEGPLRVDRPDNAQDAIKASLKPIGPIIVSLPAHVATPAVLASLAPTGALGYAATADSLTREGNSALTTPPAIFVDIAGVREAIAAYRAGDFANGEAFAAQTTNSVARAAVDWAALRLNPNYSGIVAFLAAHPDWLAAAGLRRRAEEALYNDSRPARQILDFFARRQPETPQGRFALARALQGEGRAAEAVELARKIWREDTFAGSFEANLRKEFGEVLAKADHKFRADRLAYKDSGGASIRIAALAGPDVLALAKARENMNEKLISALPPQLKKDPTLLFLRIQKLRKDNKIAEAAQLMLAAPRDPGLLVNPDEWWVERRMLGRRVLDLGDAGTAWRIVSEHSASARDNRIEAEFHSGWIALRYLGDAALAKNHFANCARLAETPMSISRAAYWQGRAADALADTDAASTFYQTAASHSANYYGQLARARLGRSDLTIRKPARVAKGEERVEAIRVVELLEALEQKDFAAPLALEAARAIDDEAQIAALAEVMARARNAGVTLSIGKIASQRGFPLDEPAFPTFGIPFFEPLARAAETPMVYAIARQESAFAPTALSTAGAKGLMQMMTPTARVTAQRAGVPFDETRLIRDAAFNAQLGSAHLADLLNEYRNSNILTFAAYNAGGKRVREWIAAYGDPRLPDVDPVDWIERIPISETRNYVQRIVENLEIYRVRLGGKPNLDIGNTIKSADARK